MPLINGNGGPLTVERSYAAHPEILEQRDDLLALRTLGTVEGNTLYTQLADVRNHLSSKHGITVEADVFSSGQTFFPRSVRLIVSKPTTALSPDTVRGYLDQADISYESVCFFEDEYDTKIVYVKPAFVPNLEQV